MALKIQAKSKTEAEVYIYDEIGDYWGMGVSAKDFVREINALKAEVSTINLHINSPGGNVFDGTTMYNALRQHKAKVVTHVDGLAASAASLVAMAGDEISISGNAFIMIHNPWTIAVGDAAAMRKSAETLESLREVFAQTYYARSNGKSSFVEILNLMDAESWLNAEASVAAGLADNITEQLEMAAKFDMDRYKYKNIPETVKAQSAMTVDMARRSRLAAMNMEVMKFSYAQANRQSI